jgi:hypothetical protein
VADCPNEYDADVLIGVRRKVSTFSVLAPIRKVLYGAIITAEANGFEK